MVNGLSKNTVVLIKAPISGVLSHAVESEIIESNPLNDLKFRKKKQKFKVEPLTESEANRLLEQYKIHLNGFYYPHMLCALRTGMRIGEIIALKWEDIDFEKRQIVVKRSCRNGRITGTKNNKRRHVDMTPHLAETLNAFRTEQKKRALKKGWSFPEWVFASRHGKMLTDIAFRNALVRCLEDAKLKRIRVHDLRHSYATIRLLKGHNVGDVSYQLGHSIIQITYDAYGHWIPGHFKSEVDELDGMHPNAPKAHPTETEG